jgi:uncharacterized protein YbjT (DUF2867 family)
MKVLIAGAGGLLGKEIISAFNRKGVVPDGLAYKKEEFDSIQGTLARKIGCDITKPEQIKDICKGVDIVISIIGITRLETEITHMDVDYRGNLNLLNEAKKDGVNKFVFISPAGADQGRKDVPLFEAKYLFEEALKASGMKWLIFRSGGFYKDLADYGKGATTGKIYVVNDGCNKFTPIDIGDLAEIMAEDSFAKENQTIEVGGPQDLTWIDICTACFEAVGKKPKFVHVPKWLCSFVLLLIRPFSNKYYSMGKLILFTSTHDLPTAKRGKITFTEYVKNYYLENKG